LIQDVDVENTESVCCGVFRFPVLISNICKWFKTWHVHS